MLSQMKYEVNELPINVENDAIYIINQSNPNTYTHGIFKYPCKFIPEVPRWAIKAFYSDESKKSIILDPFSGSGTTLLEASLHGIHSVGTEIDEIAKLISKVKVTKLDSSDIEAIQSFTNDIVKIIREKLYQKKDVLLPEIDNLNHWFNEQNLLDLGHLYKMILSLSSTNAKDFLLICFASIIKKASNADDISPKPYVSNKIIKNPSCVATLFDNIVGKYLQMVKQLDKLDLSDIKIDGDALNIPLEENSVRLAITSPPYINAFDYVRTMRLENLWLRTSSEVVLREKKKKYLGTESISVKHEINHLEILSDSLLLNDYYTKLADIDLKRSLVLKRFFEDMKKNLQEVYRVLECEGFYVIVIGNSSIRKINIESWKVLKEIAEKIGYKFVTHFGYEIKNPYIRIPRGNKGGKIAIDHILVLKK